MIPNIAALSKQFNTYMYLDKKNIQINSFPNSHENSLLVLIRNALTSTLNTLISRAMLLYLLYVFGQTALSKQCRPRWDDSVTSHLGLHCLQLDLQFLDTTLGTKLFSFKF